MTPATTPSAPSTPGTPRVLVMGEALIDAVYDSSGGVTEHVGGSPANVAFGIGALEHPVELAAWIGKDDRGARIAEKCRSHGVELTPGSDAADHTSVGHAHLDEHGAATYVFDLEWILPQIEDGRFGHLHAGSIAAVLEPGGSDVRETISRLRPTATVSYDPNARPSLMGSPQEAAAIVTGIIAMSDVVKMSDEDAEWFYPELTLEEIASGFGGRFGAGDDYAGPSLIVVTRGGEGALFGLPHSGDGGSISTHVTDVVDTVGAGDSFMAGLLSGLLDAGLIGGPHERTALAAADSAAVLPALARGIRTSGITVGRAGAHAPTRADLEGDPAVS